MRESGISKRDVAVDGDLAVALGDVSSVWMQAVRGARGPRPSRFLAVRELHMARPMIDCAAHRFHRPRNLTVEQHHVIPRAWQAFWAPPTPKPPPTLSLVTEAVSEPGSDPRMDAGPLWDPRTLPLCPTGHRNVHIWIVRLMHDANEGMTRTVKPKGNEAQIAVLALSRWVDAGGSLTALANAGLWGEA